MAPSKKTEAVPSSSNWFRNSILVIALALLAHTYVPIWYNLTPGGRAGANSLDTLREDLLDRYDKFYENATEWNTDTQPAHDEENNKNAAERSKRLASCPQNPGS